MSQALHTPATATSPSVQPSAPRWHSGGFFQTLGPAFYSPVQAQPLPGAFWGHRNEALAHSLGLSAWLQTEDALALLSGNAAPNTEAAIATVYSGHQFGVWAGQLGDGRALLLGQVDSADPSFGVQELQLKGAGRTPYSRMGDGRAVLRSSIREYLGSEALHGLGIPTTRALALVGSTLPVRRETVETAAVVTRVAPSFLRFGHFEHFAHTAADTTALQALADATIARFYPELADHAPPPRRYAALLEAVALRTARLLAQWQAVGFCHGVMNTDNLSILGLTIDYGPFGFLDAFDPGHICNHSDDRGRYAYARQPQVAFWNLHALAHALMPLIGDSDTALAALEPYKAAYAEHFLALMRAKLGLATAQDADRDLVDDLLRLMAQDKVDMSICFRRLSRFNSLPMAANPGPRDLFLDRAAFDAWGQRYATRLQAETSVDAERAARMNAVNPKYVLRNHLAETAIRRATEGDFSEVDRLLTLLHRPFDEHPAHEAAAGFPPDWAQHLEVSCSS